MKVEIIDGSFVVQAALVGGLLGIPPERVPTLMRDGAITSVCERGIDLDQGTFRLSFYYQARRARLRIDALGHVLQRSVIDFGTRVSPHFLRSGSPGGGSSAANFHGNNGEGTSPLMREINSQQKRVLKAES
jgi:hypothetical protein